MKFKIDENLPEEFAVLLRGAYHDVVTVRTQGLSGGTDPALAEICRQEGRILVTLDLDFADTQTYPPQKYPGFMVFRVHRQDKPYLITILQRTIPLITQEPITHRLWIVEETRVRIRGEEVE
ncbi:MAG TPA: DUF5615 family PIN-like protein [Candidatus Binatia bacterium]|nr:DUF5615 family PIN-like protein [Candidatus Binatia bacterium]